MNQPKEKISVIVPCYNEEESLPFLYKEVTEVLKGISNISYELLFIDDGSKDHTMDILKVLAYEDNQCHYYSFSRNFGKEAAMLAGLRQATGDYCVIIDADLQHPPHLLKDMYQALKEENYDCCAGKRVSRKGENKLRSWLSVLFYRILQRFTKMDMSDGAGDFRMMKRKMVNAILQVGEYNRYLKGIFSYVGFETKWIDFHNVERVAGKTKWTFKNLFGYAFEGIISFSTIPLQLSGILALFLCIGTVLVGGFTIIDFFRTGILHKLLWVLTFGLGISALQLLCIYILGQYIAKDYLENKKRPIYIIKERSDTIEK